MKSLSTNIVHHLLNGSQWTLTLHTGFILQVMYVNIILLVFLYVLCVLQNDNTTNLSNIFYFNTGTNSINREFCDLDHCKPCAGCVLSSVFNLLAKTTEESWRHSSGYVPGSTAAWFEVAFISVTQTVRETLHTEVEFLGVGVCLNL